VYIWFLSKLVRLCRGPYTFKKKIKLAPQSKFGSYLWSNRAVEPTFQPESTLLFSHGTSFFSHNKTALQISHNRNKSYRMTAKPIGRRWSSACRYWCRPSRVRASNGGVEHNARGLGPERNQGLGHAYMTGRGL
jgi:hypothetical protein